MTPALAREIADEHIAFSRDLRQHRPIRAREIWEAMTPDRYPGGGWEAVRAWMIGWLLQ